MNTNSKSVTVVIRLHDQTRQMEMARRELKRSSGSSLANEPACYGILCTTTRETRNVC